MFADTTSPGKPASTMPELGTSVGRYVVLELVGQGAMGRVLRAYDPKLQREVALKLVSDEALDVDSRDRMLREARAMAQLSHPNVVPVYDVEESSVGVTLVMEYIPGQTLGQWRRSTDAPWSEVIAHYLEAGRGLAAAHAADLLHRDFKPANVLVAPSGEVKVTDFGLAKLTAAANSGRSLDESSIRSGASLGGPTTRMGTIQGTPRYMPPEQHRGESLGPAADQYAFCVALWEALVGTPPFGATTIHELRVEKEDGVPSWPADGPNVSRSVIDALTRGLAPKPDDRWPSMEALLAVLTHDPNSRRSRRLLGLGGVSLIALASAGAWAWTMMRAQRCSGAREHLAGVWDDARRQQVEDAMAATGVPYATTTWTRTAAQLDDYAEAWVQEHTEACEATAVRKEQSAEVMDLRMGCLRQATVELSAVVGELAQADDKTMENAHRVVGGLPKLSRCTDREVLEAEVPPPDEEIAQTVETLRAEAARAKAKVDAGHYDEAVELLEGLEPQVEAVGYGPLHTEVLLRFGYALDRAGRYDHATIKLQQALRSGLSWRQWAWAREAATSLVYVCGYRQERIKEGLAYAETARGLLGQTPDPAAEASVRSTHGALLSVQGKYELAEKEQRAALSLRLQTLGHDHPFVADSRSNLGNDLMSRGNYEQAEVELRAALSIRLEFFGPDHPVVAMSHSSLGAVLMSRGKYEQAEAELRAALSLQLELLGPNHPSVANLHYNLAALLMLQGQYEQAEAEHRIALSHRIKYLGYDHPLVADSHGAIGHILMLQGQYEQAEAEQRTALSIRIKHFGPDSHHVAYSHGDLGNVLMWSRQYEQAEAEQRTALALLVKILGADQPQVAYTHNNLGMTLEKQGKYEQAEAEQRTALALLVKLLGADHPDVADPQNNLGVVLEKQGKHEQAEAEHRAALSLRLEVLGPNHPHIALSRNNLAIALESQGKNLDEALALAEAAWSRRVETDIPGEDRAETAFLLARLLWQTSAHGPPRARALDLATRALDLYQQAGELHVQEAEEVRAWLAERHR